MTYIYSSENKITSFFHASMVHIKKITKVFKKITKEFKKITKENKNNTEM